jgi:hypothetical protein
MAALASVAAVEIEFPSCALFAINSLLFAELSERVSVFDM